MKILMLCHDLPNPYSGGTSRTYNLIKLLSEKYNYEITLLSFKQKTHDSIYDHDLNKYCQSAFSLDIMEKNSSTYDIFIYTIITSISLRNIFSNSSALLNFYYSPAMQEKINAILRSNEYDAIYSDGPMACYLHNVKIPKIVEPLDAGSSSYHKAFLREKNLLKKLYLYLRYRKAKNYEITVYRNFNYCIMITDNDKDILNSYSKFDNLLVIPNGVDLNYFHNIDTNDIFPSLIYVGNMENSIPINTVIHFYEKIYPLVYQHYPELIFYIVGRNPPKKIRDLANKHILITGYVQDIRPYLLKSSLSIVPMEAGTGMKTKVLESMAMQRPVISTSIGAQGINVVDRQNIYIADSDEQFANGIIDLLDNEDLRNTLAYGGRRLVETEYSWESIVSKINDIFEKIVRENAAK
jgi:polysaccharide biosynthesis protein PslH